MSKSKCFTFLLIFLSLSAIYSFYNFDSASAYTGTITYDSGTNTITCVGGSSSTPITFEDVYAADVDGGWGVVLKQGTKQYYFNSSQLKIGDGTTTTYFSDMYIDCRFGSNVSPVIDSWRIMSKATFTLVDCTVTEYLTGTTYPSSTGTIIFSRVTYKSNGVQSVLFGSASTITFTDTQFTNCRFILASKNITFDRVNIYNCPYFYFWTSSGVFSDLKISGTTRAFYIQRPYSLTVIDSVIFTTTLCEFYTSAATPTVNFVDCVVDNWHFVDASGTGGYTVNRKYTFNLNVLNGDITDFVENALVQLYKNTTLIYEGTTNSSGMIPTQTLLYGFYDAAHGDTIQNATSPYYLVISHPDWQTYVSRFYITEPLRLTVSMQEPTYTGYTEVEKSDYTTIILFVISLILCIIGLALTVPLLPLISLTISVLNIIFLSEPSIFNILLIVLNVTFTLIALVRAKTKNN